MDKPRRVLIVDPSTSTLLALAEALQPYATVYRSREFAEARRRLLALSPDLIVANVRLAEHNGLHLVYIAGAYAMRTRSVIYADDGDLGLAADAKEAGAFFERRERVRFALASYIHAALPPVDRRDVQQADRRRRSRGGRRAPDVALRYV